MTDDQGIEGDGKNADLLRRTDIWDKFHPENTRCVLCPLCGWEEEGRRVRALGASGRVNHLF
jgi:hypothetical protein